MFENARDYIYQRRKGLLKTASLLGGVYLAGRYVLERLEEMREQVVREKTARENLRRRFQQNQQDCTYTVLALVPTLGDQILEDMDVEGVTLTLQMQSKAAKSRLESSMISDVNASSVSLNTEQPSVTSSVELSMTKEVNEERDVEPSSSQLGESAQSWIDQFGAQGSGSSASNGGRALHEAVQDLGSPISSGAHLSDSIPSASASIVSGSDGERSGVMIDSLHVVESESGESQAGTGAEGPVMTTRSKAELWREVKLLTFTRTLTILYSTTLLSLLTHIQLSLLGRYKYVQSVFDLEQEEKFRERQSFEVSVSSLFWGGGDLEGLLHGLENDDSRDKLGLFGDGRTGGTERKYLTLSWWLIHVGWKEIGDRVRRAVEDVFEGVSLKAKLDLTDLERLFTDVRRRIEFDTYPPEQAAMVNEDPLSIPAPRRRISFLPSLIPSTPTALQDVLVQGGLPHHLTNVDDTAFLQLVDETRTFVSSADFGRVLEICLDHATDVLFDGLRRSLFPEGLAADGEKVRLAGLLPGVARWSHAAVHGTPNELVEGLADVRALTGFSAIIYSSYDETLP